MEKRTIFFGLDGYRDRMEEDMLPPVPGVDASRQLETLQRVHTQKVKTLMASIHALKEQLAIAKAATKEHRRRFQYPFLLSSVTLKFT